ncbi:hypothetical protein F5Y19DRAFT_480269 [Xylariaceae sp. FL1651]|nr:hypothetical protein F5Y19DRAFT_480269 [Xylariaceae sp. FL1651]
MADQFLDLPRTNVLASYAGQGNVMLDPEVGRWTSKRSINGPPRLPQQYKFSQELLSVFDALQVLQAKRDQYLLDSTLKVPLDFMFNALPNMVRADVNIFLPEQDAFWAWPDDVSADTGDGVNSFAYYGRPRLLEKPFHFWPIDINQHEGRPPHWALIVLHLERSRGINPDWDGLDSQDEFIDISDDFNVLQSYAVIDPDHGDEARDTEHDIIDKLLVILNVLGVMNAPQHASSDGRENWSSGLRVFEMIRVWLDRITESYCLNPRLYDERAFWRPHPGWFNPDSVRSNMIGMAATMVNRAMESTTRVAIEPVLDGAIVFMPNGETIGTQTMMPDRQNVAAFDPSQNRTDPVAISENLP